MVDQYGFPLTSSLSVERYYGNTSNGNSVWNVWSKPTGITMIHFFMIGHGGQGGQGAIGAASTAAGGGGGGSGAQVSLLIPAVLLPDILYFSLTRSEFGAGNSSFLSILPNSGANHTILNVSPGGYGNNASGATAGTGGSGGSVGGFSSYSLAGLGIFSGFAGQSGTTGGTTGVGTNITLPTGGVVATGGTGGGGLPAAATAGSNGGAFNATSLPSAYPATAGGIGSINPTDIPGNGNEGINSFFKGLTFFLGGTGGGSNNGSATGAGLVQSMGGNGGIGCGGGGSGGALTGSTAANAARGGTSYLQIICW